MIELLIITAGFALVTYTSRLAENRRAARARAHERMRRTR
jgi:hypothetical protein